MNINLVLYRAYALLSVLHIYPLLRASVLIGIALWGMRALTGRGGD